MLQKNFKYCKQKQRRSNVKTSDTTTQSVLYSKCVVALHCTALSRLQLHRENRPCVFHTLHPFQKAPSSYLRGGGFKFDPRRHQTILKRNSKTETTELYSQKVRIPYTSLHNHSMLWQIQTKSQAQAQSHHRMKEYPIKVQNPSILESMCDFLGLKFRIILNLYWIPIDAVVVFRPEHYFLFKSATTYCVTQKRSQIDMRRNYILRLADAQFK